MVFLTVPSTRPTRTQRSLLGKLSCHPLELNRTIITNSWQTHVNRTAAIDYTHRVRRTISSSAAGSQLIAILIASTEARSISSGVTLAVESAVGATVDEGAAHLTGTLGDGADTVDTFARGADIAACSAVVGVGQEVCSTTGGRGCWRLFRTRSESVKVGLDSHLQLPNTSKR
jgi:hypothetical protein